MKRQILRGWQNRAGYEVQSATFDAESVSPDAELVKVADGLNAEGDVTGVIESEYGLYVGKAGQFVRQRSNRSGEEKHHRTAKAKAI